MTSQPTEPEPRRPASPAGKAGERRKPSPLIFLSAGTEFTAVCAAMSLLGWWLDKKAETAPLLMIIGLAMGLIGGTYKLYKTGQRFFRK